MDGRDILQGAYWIFMMLVAGKKTPTAEPDNSRRVITNYPGGKQEIWRTHGSTKFAVPPEIARYARGWPRTRFWGPEV